MGELTAGKHPPYIIPHSFTWSSHRIRSQAFDEVDVGFGLGFPTRPWGIAETRRGEAAITARKADRATMFCKCKREWGKKRAV